MGLSQKVAALLHLGPSVGRRYGGSGRLLQASRVLKSKSGTELGAFLWVDEVVSLAIPHAKLLSTRSTFSRSLYSS